MTRVAIIGNAGGGKSTLARKLGVALGLPVYHIDLLQWKPGWVSTPLAEFDREHNRWLAQPGWIIDGWGRPEAIQTRFELADTIILVDFPIRLHYWWAAKRQIQSLIQPRADWPPPGCSAFAVTGRLLRLMWTIHQTMRPQLLERVLRYRGQKRVEHLRSPRALDQLLQATASERRATSTSI